MNGLQIVSGTDLGNVPTVWSVVGTGDFNGDGKGDILWRNTATGVVDIWLMNGTQMISATDIGNVPLAWSVAGELVNCRNWRFQRERPSRHTMAQQ
jgi:hypothetical protein